MTRSKEPHKPNDERARRLAEALRANLRKRKTQLRDRRQSPGGQDVHEQVAEERASSDVSSDP